MTKIGLECEGAELGLCVLGHAERSTDEDVNLCCAGISMLVQTAAELARRYEDKGYAQEMTIDNTDGESVLYLKLHSYKENRTVAMYEFLKAGFDLLKERYPDKIAWGEK